MANTPNCQLLIPTIPVFVIDLFFFFGFEYEVPFSYHKNFLCVEGLSPGLWLEVGFGKVIAS